MDIAVEEEAKGGNSKAFEAAVFRLTCCMQRWLTWGDFRNPVRIFAGGSMYSVMTLDVEERSESQHYSWPEIVEMLDAEEEKFAA